MENRAQSLRDSTSICSYLDLYGLPALPLPIADRGYFCTASDSASYYRLMRVEESFHGCQTGSKTRIHPEYTRGRRYRV